MKRLKLFFGVLLFIQIGCEVKPKKNHTKIKVAEKKQLKKVEAIENKVTYLDDKNAIPFFYEYAKKNKENKVRIITKYGNIDILLYNNTPYHRANFIYLTKKKYFDGTMFHRVVPKFIIQGGNSDSRKIMKKRGKIGRYLLPPDTKKGNSHHRGVISMPSSEIDNPHKLASPFEFFIVQQSPGAYHLDGNYTAFGEVIKGMHVVDIINQQKVDKREMPISNIYMNIEIIN
ncbi:MAG: peptidylprolyl isomerase [Bacteroidota bacterium]|nr:peptidylprolyl isomerase [Bacteroidota bacterium]